MIAKISYVVSILSVLLAALLGVVAVWFEALLPDGFVGRSMTTLGIIFTAAVVCAIVNLFLPNN